VISKNFYLKVFGLDSLVLFSITAKIAQAFGMLILLASVNYSLDEIQRGFYFSFTSLAALQIFFELGIGVVVMQHAARFIVSCGGSLESNIKTNEEAVDRIIGLFHFNIIWTFFAGLCLFIIIFPLGVFFFNSIPESNTVSWFYEWLLLSISIGLFLPISSQLSFFEGAGYLSEVLKLRLLLAILSYMVAILALFFGMGLYAVSFLFITQITITIFWMITKKRVVFKKMFSKFPTFTNFTVWLRRLLPMQWKIAVSWVCGYISFQTATPITLSYFGATAAGELGLFLNITNMFIGFMGAWMTTKIPIFSKFIEDGHIKGLNSLYSLTIKRSILVFCTLSIVIYLIAQIYLNYSQPKFMTTLSVLSFIFIAGLASISYAQAVYLRSFLQELFVPSSLAYAICVLILIPILLPLYKLNGLLASFIIAGFISTSMTTYIYLSFKRKNINYS
jgi:O-antigen/teichoic acid export membrane protein